MSLQAGSMEWNFRWLPQEAFRGQDPARILLGLQGRWESVGMQGGWSEPQELKGYILEIDARGSLSVFRAAQGTGVQVLLWTLKLLIANRDGYLTATTKLVKGAAEDTLSPASAMGPGMLKGGLQISKDGRAMMFLNGLEIDAGPATVWRRLP
jgi:hypothetical protein